MPRLSNQRFASQAVAICTREQAQQLVNYDHHVVRVEGQDGVLLTHGWMPVEDHSGPFVLTVVFHDAGKHPRAPQEVQSLVDTLSFQIRGQPR